MPYPPTRGLKSIKKTKKWCKKKFGYGWVTREVTEYTCMTKEEVTLVTTMSSQMEVSCRSPAEVAVQKGEKVLEVSGRNET